MSDFAEIAPCVWRLPLLPLDSLNVYLLGTVLVDSGASLTRRRLLRALDGRELTAHALTHVHPDHQGASHIVCETYGLPLLCGTGDRMAAESGDLASVLPNPTSLFARVSSWSAGEGHPVHGVLVDGDSIADFSVVETPGHTPGHLAFWRQEDRILILGDVLFHRNPLTLRPGLREPFAIATHDPQLNRDSARRLAALDPQLICFAHGEPLTDAALFQDLVARLPR